ncbi:hypothetical protein Tco_0111599 [Tanacetum coccineum]
MKDLQHSFRNSDEYYHDPEKCEHAGPKVTTSQEGNTPQQGGLRDLLASLEMEKQAFRRTMGTHDDEARSSRSKRSRQHETVKELCQEFYSTYEYDKVCAEDELQTKKIIKFRLGGRAHNLTLLEFVRRLGLYHADELEEDGFNVYFEGGLRSDEHFNAQEYWTTQYDKVQKNDIWLLIMFDARYQYRYANVAWLIVRRMKQKGADLDATPLRDLIDSEGKLIPEDPQPGVPRVGIPRPLRASMQDLYDKMGRIEIRQ